MKKLYIALGVFMLACLGMNAQTIPNGTMESWRVSSAGSTNPKIVRAPNGWYGADSLIIGLGQALGPLFSIPDTVWQQQLFKDSGANAHGGSYSAMMVTKDQDTLGIFPGIMTNAQTNVDLSTFNITFSGGLGTVLRTTSVSAWVKYVPANTLDSANITVQAYGNIAGIDTVLGFGYLKIGSTPSFTQVTVNVTYPDPSLIVDTLRITFASSSDTAFVGSTLWVDDVTAVGVSQPISVASVNANNQVAVYPNPANDVLYISGTKNVSISMMSVNGAVVATKAINGKDKLDISSLPSGLYFYTLSENGNIVQRGKVSVVR